MALQRNAIWSKMPPGVLCWVVQELHSCLAPLLEEVNLLDLEMMDMAKKDPVAPPVPMEGPHH